MRQTVALAACAILVFVGPVWGQQRNEQDHRAQNPDPLEVLARKAALRLAGFEAQDSEEFDSADSTQVSKPKVKVYIDHNTGMMMIDGPPEEIARFEHAYDLVIEKMKQVGPAKPDIRKYKCRHIDVSLAAALLDDIFNGPQKARQRVAAQQRGRQQQQRGGRQQQRGRQPEPEPEPEPEMGGMGRGMDMLEMIFGGSGAKATDPTELMGIQIVPDKRTNYLFIMAKTDLFPQIIDTLYTVDVEALEEERDSDIVVLQKLNADEVKTMLEDLLGITDARQAQRSGANRARRAAQQRRGRGQQGQAAAELAAQLQEQSLQIGVGGQQFKVSDIKISSLAATNTIIVFGPKAARKAIVDIIHKLDDEGPDGRMIPIPLEYADAESIARALKESYSVGGRDGVKNIFITAETSSNTIYVTAPENIRGEIIERIMTAEANAMSTGIKPPKTIQILQGDAVSIAAILDTVFKDRSTSGKKITIVGEENSNTLIVRAPEDTFKDIAVLASKMDKTPTPVVPKFYRLEHAYAPEVKDQVQDIIRQLVQSVNATKGKMPNLGAFGVSADPATNSLIVMGTPTIFAIMDTVVAEVDIPPKDPTRRTTRTIPLAKNDAAEVARNVNKLFAGGSKKREGVDPPTAEANISTNAVVVAGTLKQIEEIEAFIKSLEDIATPPPGGELREYTIDLKYVDADQAAEVINNFFTQLNAARKTAGVRVKDTEKTVTVVSDMISGKLFVNASEVNKGKIDLLLDGIDQEGASDAGARQTEVFQVKYADPNNLVNAINQSFATGRRVPEKEKVTAVAEWGTQSVIVTANERNLERVRRIIAEVDKEGGQGKVVRIYEVKEARATELASVLTQTLQKSRKRTRQGQMPTSIVADEATNVLVISTTPAEYDELLPIIERLDVERKANVGRYIKVYRVKYANLGSVWAAIDGAFNRGRGVREENRVSGSVDWETGTVIITASKDRHDEIEKMLAEVDTETAGGRKIHMVKMEYGDAGSVAQALDQIIRAQKVERGQSKPTVTADAGTNTLIAYASESELAGFRTVIDAMDVEGSAPGAPQRIELEHANAAQLADLLTQIFTDSVQPRRGGRRGGGTQKIIPLIISDDASNTLIVRAAELEFGQIKKMVAELDIKSDDGPTRTRIISVAEGMDVDSLASDVERLINRGEDIERENNRNYKRKKVSIMADARSRSLVVSGASSQFDEVERIVRALEKEGAAGPREIRIINFKNIRSGDAKRVLDEIIEQRNKSRGRGRR